MTDHNVDYPARENYQRDTRPFTVEYKGRSVTVDLPGYYALGEGDSIHVGGDMNAASAALEQLKSEIDGIPTSIEIRALRKKLKLSQRAAGAILGVGTSAFDKYERGRISPSGPTIRLIRLLQKHPELVADLQTIAELA